MILDGRVLAVKFSGQIYSQTQGSEFIRRRSMQPSCLRSSILAPQRLIRSMASLRCEVDIDRSAYYSHEIDPKSSKSREEIEDMKRVLTGVLGAALAYITVAQASAQETAMVGFKEASAQAQRDLEERYDSHLKVDNLRRWMKQMTGRPHHAGSPKAKENAEFIAELFKEWGYETEIETFHVLFPTPKVRELVLLEPERFEAKLTEPTVDSDSVSQAIKEEGLPPFNAYSADGDVTAELVYVNQGLPGDYEELERRGIDVSGKIVLARYGGVLARYQAEGGRRKGRHRMHPLQRPKSRRVLRGRRLS